MVNPGDGGNVYCLIHNENGLLVDEVSFHGYNKHKEVYLLILKYR